MADLFNQQISATYSGLLKTSSSGVLSASLSQISDGRGNTSPLYLSTDSIQFYGAYSFPSSDGSANQVLKTDGAGVLTWEDDANSGTVTSVALSVPTGLTVTGSPITTNGTITIGGTLGVANGGTGATTLTGILVGNGTSDISSVTDGTVGQVLSTNGSGTYSFIDAAGGDVTKTGTITANQIAVWNDSTDELRSDETVTIGTDHSITLYQPNTNSNTTNYIIGGGSSMTTGELNTGFGSSVLTLNTTGIGNIAIGSDSLTTNVSGYNNVAVGVNTLKRTTASNNVAIGNSVLQFDTTGYENTAIGGLSQYNITTAYGNTSLGYNSLIFNSTGIQNTAIGWNSLKGVSTYSASNNTAIGYNSGSAITTGSYNVIIGSNTGSTIATSSSNIIISDGIGNIRQSFDFTGAATFSGSVDIYKTTDSQLQIKSLNEDATLIINSGADGVGGANREEGFIKFYQDNADFFTLGKRNNGQFVLTDHTASQDVITFQDGGGILIQPANNLTTFSGVVNIPVGAEATPSLIFAGDSDSGMWHPAANTLAFSTFGNERLRIESGGATTFGSTSSATSTGASIQHLSNGFLYVKGGVGGIVIGDDSTTSRMQIYDNSDIVFERAGSEAMRISSGGDATFSSSVTTNATVANSYLSFSSRYSTDSNYRLDIRQVVTSGLVKHAFNVINGGTSYDNNLVLDRGNVGIGTATTDGRLKISAPSGVSNVSGISLYGNNSGTYGGSNVVRSKIESQTDGTAFGANMLFYTNDGANVYQERMRISSTGVATFSNNIIAPRFNAAGSIMGGFTSSGSSSIIWEIGSDAAVGTGMYLYNNSGGYALKLTAAGTLTTLGGGTSDRRLKEKIEYINSDGIESIKKLKPVKFEFKQSEKSTELKRKQRRGFIAQDVLEVIPDLVLGDGEKKDGVYGLDYDGVLALSVKAIQEQQTIIEDLKARIETLEG